MLPLYVMGRNRRIKPYFHVMNETDQREDRKQNYYFFHLLPPVNSRINSLITNFIAAYPTSRTPIAYIGAKQALVLKPGGT